jgi:hypothetical protein
MRKLPLLVLVISVAAVAFAQEDGPIPKPSPASRRYHDYRLARTDPTFKLTKVKAVIRKIKEDPDMNQRLPDKAFSALSVEEKFTYCMIHAEDFSQNCSMMMPIEQEQTKIFAFVPDAFGGEQIWSERQMSFLTKNRVKVLPLLRSTIRSHHRVGVNLKAAITHLSATELIPELISAYKRDRRDNDILTVLMTLMKEAKYKPFLASASYRKLYADENSSYKAFLEATSANQELILSRAGAFYRDRFK